MHICVSLLNDLDNKTIHVTSLLMNAYTHMCEPAQLSGQQSVPLHKHFDRYIHMYIRVTKPTHADAHTHKTHTHTQNTHHMAIHAPAKTPCTHTKHTPHDQTRTRKNTLHTHVNHAPHGYTRTRKNTLHTHT
jgi:hypothetical protein